MQKAIDSVIESGGRLTLQNILLAAEISRKSWDKTYLPNAWYTDTCGIVLQIVEAWAVDLLFDKNIPSAGVKYYLNNTCKDNFKNTQEVLVGGDSVLVAALNRGMAALEVGLEDGRGTDLLEYNPGGDVDGQ